MQLPGIILVVFSDTSPIKSELAFEGAPDAVESMLEFAQDGPRNAQVERVDVSEEEPEGLSDFSVR